MSIPVVPLEYYQDSQVSLRRTGRLLALLALIVSACGLFTNAAGLLSGFALRTPVNFYWYFLTLHVIGLFQHVLMLAAGATYLLSIRWSWQLAVGYLIATLARSVSSLAWSLFMRRSNAWNVVGYIMESTTQLSYWMFLVIVLFVLFHPVVKGILQPERI
jgi:hypothetical protein